MMTHWQWVSICDLTCLAVVLASTNHTLALKVI